MDRQFVGKVGSVAALVATLQFFHQIAGPHEVFGRGSEAVPKGTSRAPFVPQRARLVRVSDDPGEQSQFEAVRETASVGVTGSLVLVGLVGALWFATRGRLRLQAR